ncbi:hypothetical protein PP427_gp030 [Salmonella phage KM16]|nr:hypothetical protein PP427_gp030 [Salmonella phage KM16]
MKFWAAKTKIVSIANRAEALLEDI